jgi:hypothetical protein
MWWNTLIRPKRGSIMEQVLLKDPLVIVTIKRGLKELVLFVIRHDIKLRTIVIIKERMLKPI